MFNIHEYFEKELNTVPSRILQKIFSKKLRAAGVRPAKRLVDELVSHVLNEPRGKFIWDDGRKTHKEVILEFSDSDIAEVESLLSEFFESLPDLVEDLSKRLANAVLRRLRKNWAQEQLSQLEEQCAFQWNLEKRWGKPLGMLRMLLTISRELGEKVFELNSTDDSKLNNVMLRLHVRACQITAEIITLLENGYADGAMARWRTLHEIGIVTILMREHGDGLAERYVAHRSVEAKLGKDQYMLHCERLGCEPISSSDCFEIDEAYNQAIAVYGKAFGGPYGWANGFVPGRNSSKITFGDLEAEAGRAPMASYYKLASYNVHAGPHALFFRLGLTNIFINNVR